MWPTGTSKSRACFPVPFSAWVTSTKRYWVTLGERRRHAGRTGVSYSDHYEEKGVFERLMNRLRKIVPHAQGYAPVMVPALC